MTTATALEQASELCSLSRFSITLTESGPLPHVPERCPSCRKIASALMQAYADGLRGRGFGFDYEIEEAQRIRAEADKLEMGKE